MKVFSTLLVSSILLYTVAACTAPTAPQSPANLQLEPSETEIKTLASTYTTFPALNQDLKLSPTHGGIMVRTHLETTAMQAFQNKSFPLPDGAIAVKEGHQTKEGPIERIYVMKKVKNYDPANGDWFYAVLSPTGTVNQKGKIQMCISCHSAAKDKDYIYGF